MGFTVLVTGDPQDLPRLIRIEMPDLILLDLMLPEIDGIKLMERMPELADIPSFSSRYIEVTRRLSGLLNSEPPTTLSSRFRRPN